jgi:hypothetical protein
MHMVSDETAAAIIRPPFFMFSHSKICGKRSFFEKATGMQHVSFSL